MIEAIACGTKVIAWNHGGASEILKKLFPQGLVDLDEMGKLCETTVSLINSSFKPSENIFTAKRMTDSTIKLYGELIKNN